MTFSRARKKGQHLRPSLREGKLERRDGLYRSDIDAINRGERARRERAELLTGATIGSFSPISISFPSSSPPRYALTSALGADSASFTAAWWEKPGATADGVDYVFSDNNASRGVRLSSIRNSDTSAPSTVGFDNASNSLQNDVATILDLALADDEWNFVAVSMRAISTRSLSICVINSAGLTTQTDFDVTGNPLSFSFSEMTASVLGAFNTIGSSSYLGDLAEVFVARDTDLVDFAQAGNRRTFITADGPGGKPVSLGADGSLPFGAQPMVYFTGTSPSTWNNVGAAGAYTLTGSATAGDAPLVPSAAASGVAWDAGATWDNGVLWS